SMADAEHAPAMAPPVRTDEQIMPRIRWVPIGKSNCYLNEEKSQPSPIYKIGGNSIANKFLQSCLQRHHTIPAILYSTILVILFVLTVKAGNLRVERTKSPSAQFPLWGLLLNRAHIDYAERMWEEFTHFRFTELIIFHLQTDLPTSHPRPESPLHLPTEDTLILGNLKFSAKGTKREVFGVGHNTMELINDVIRGADYYDAYLKKVAKHQRYLAGEEVSDPDSPAPKASQAFLIYQVLTETPKAASKKPKPAPAKPQEKKRKPVSESSEAPPLAKRAKARKVVKKRTVKSSKQLGRLEFVDEGVTRCSKPCLDDTEEAILQRMPGKGKEKVDYSRTFRNQRAEESSSLYAELGLYGSDTESDEEMPSVVRSGAQDEGQAGPTPVSRGPNLIPRMLRSLIPPVQTITEHMMKGSLARSIYPVCIGESEATLRLMNKVIPEEPCQLSGTLEQTVATLEFIDYKRLIEINDSVKGCYSSVKHAMRAPLRARFKDLPTSDMKEILLQRMLEENYDKGHCYNEGFWHNRSLRFCSSSSSTNLWPYNHLIRGSCQPSTAAPSSSKISASAEYSAWTTTNTRIKPSITTIPNDLYMDDETTADEQAYSSGDEVGRDHIPTVNLRQSWWKPLTEDRPATPEPAWTYSIIGI
ncbi:hypothetical protein Tco_0470937, partial [Tanacetum coccineum]